MEEEIQITNYSNSSLITCQGVTYNNSVIITISWSRYYDYLHFTEKVTKAKRG